MNALAAPSITLAVLTATPANKLIAHAQQPNKMNLMLTQNQTSGAVLARKQTPNTEQVSMPVARSVLMGRATCAAPREAVWSQ